MAQSVDGSSGINQPSSAIKDDNQSADKSPDSSPCPSPDGKCAICLGRLENKSFTDSCFHTFCFTCLQEWSKVRPECPLCKQRFNSIIHNVRSNDQYDKYDLAAHQPEQEDPTWYGYSATRRFRYHTTLTAERRQRIAWLQRLSNFNPHAYNPRVLWRYRRQAATSEFRRHVYSNNLWVQPSTGRFRDTSPHFYRTNPACLHRLVPWLNRELNVLLYNYESHVSFILELILSLLPRFNMFSEEFREHISPFLSAQTAHFLHEFYNFARSPYDMVAYDSHAVYPDYPRHELIDLSPENSTSKSSTTQPVITISSTSSSSSSSDSDVYEYLDKFEKKTLNIITKVKKFLSTEIEDSKIHARLKASEAKDSSNASPNQPGPSGLQTNIKKLSDTGWDSDSSIEPPSKWAKTDDLDSDCGSVVIVDCLKPKGERTPQVFTIDSDTDEFIDPVGDDDDDIDSNKLPKIISKVKKEKKKLKKKHKRKKKKLSKKKLTDESADC